MYTQYLLSPGEEGGYEGGIGHLHPPLTPHTNIRCVLMDHTLCQNDTWTLDLCMYCQTPDTTGGE